MSVTGLHNLTIVKPHHYKTSPLQTSPLQTSPLQNLTIVKSYHCKTLLLQNLTIVKQTSPLQNAYYGNDLNIDVVIHNDVC